jgi:type IV pilus biogenesis protein CpaD/CtpE
MNKLLIALLATTLVGCASQPYRPPLDVSTIPNDCGNKNSIITWLDRQASIPSQTLESKEDYERSRGQIRSRIWSLRYHCQPV